MLLLPDISIFNSFMKNGVISNGEHVILDIAEPRSVFYSGKRAGCPSKNSSAFQRPNSNPSFFVPFPFTQSLITGRKIVSFYSLSHSSWTLSFPRVHYLRFLPFSLNIWILQFRACNGFRQIKYIIQEWLGLCLMCLPSSLRRWKVSIKWCPFCLISCFDLVFSLSLKAEWVSTQGLCNSLIIETIHHKGSLRAITSIEPMSQLCICTKSKQ